MEEKCKFDMCVHSELEHDEGSCMHVTQEELRNVPTMDKYCPCSSEGGVNLRLYKKVGFMEQEFRDLMVTRPCWCCGEDVLIRVEQVVCIECQNWLGLL